VGFSRLEEVVVMTSGSRGQEIGEAPPEGTER